MADNYLERRMEEYRSGRLASHSHTTSSMRSPRKNNELVLRYMPIVVAVVADELTPLLTAVVASFTAVGCRVAFTAGDAKKSAELAQRTGARYYPGAVALPDMTCDIASHWGEVEVVVSFGPASALSHVSLPRDVRMIDAASLEAAMPSGIPASRLARHILYLAHPDNAFLLDR